MPVHRTRLIGREQERALGRAFLLDEAVPLLTLTGPGGVGKTRLALAIASNVASAFAGGVVFVDLAALADPALVATAVATSAGVTPSGDGPLVEALIGHLHPRQLLLILDNCEHVLPAVAGVTAALLTGCPALQVLATSRAPLRVQGEQVLAVPPLTLPAPGATGLAEVQRSEAVTFFADRARAVVSSFHLTQANAAAVAEICRYLDGLPLALELAAARSGVLSPAALHYLLGQHVPVLGSGAQDGPIRHQTMHTALDWSYALLAPDDQMFLRSLAVFAGGWTLDAAAAMHDVALPTALDRLDTLLNQSLIVRQTSSDAAAPRFTMLETIRTFALEQVSQGGESDKFRSAHAAWMLDLAHRAQPELFSGNALPWLVCLDAELDNIRAAMTWWQQSGQPLSAMDFLAATDEYWAARRYRAEVRCWAEAALAAAPDAPPLLRSAVLHIAVFSARSLGDFPAALAHAEAGLAAAQASGELMALGRAYYQLGNAWHHIDVSRAAAAAAEAVNVFRQAGHRGWLAGSLADLGDKLHSCGDLARAASLLDEALAHQRASRYSWGIAEALGQRAHVARSQGDLAGATRWFTESIPLAQEIGDEHKIMGAVAGLAGVALDLGQPHRAATLLGAVAAEQAATGWPRVAHQVHVDAITAQVRAKLGVEAFAIATAAGRKMPFATAMADALALAQPEGSSPSAATPGWEGPRQASETDPASHGQAISAREPCALTSREHEVLALLCQRQTNAEIAAALFLSPRTIETHVAHVIAKLGATNRREAAAVAARAGLIQARTLAT